MEHMFINRLFFFFISRQSRLQEAANKKITKKNGISFQTYIYIENNENLCKQDLLMQIHKKREKKLCQGCSH